MDEYLNYYLKPKYSNLLLSLFNTSIVLSAIVLSSSNLLNTDCVTQNASCLT